MADRVYTLYVIPGSHACRAAMLMLEHKGLPYRRVDIVTLAHPFVVRLLGFDAGGQTRIAGTRRSLGLRLGDRLGTVPALAAGRRRIATNHGIARFLDEHHPQPPLLPADPERRAEVEEAERWANDTLQMAARLILAGAALSSPAAFARSSGDGRMGHLLYRGERARRVMIPRVLHSVFGASRATDADRLAELPGLLDHVDGLIAGGVIGSAQPNAADCLVAPSLALMLYRRDVRPMFEGRPALGLVDRLLPEPVRPAPAA